ncbi:dinucleotide-utilizing enzymes [Pseudonocardia sp. N23]|nr:dinucleotide-utilizing enzymes [Pseudonocardia sp. N23]
MGRAVRAPSIHNTQPWSWRVQPGRIMLFADDGRRLVATDPDGRDLMVSCGAALQHLRVALAGVGAATTTLRLPDPERRDHLATVRICDGLPSHADSSLFAQLDRRRSDRRPYASGAPDAVVDGLRARAGAYGAGLVRVEGAARSRLVQALDDATAGQPHRPGYLAELLAWTHRYSGARDGIPRQSVPAAGVQGDGAHLHRFPAGTMPHHAALGPDAGTLLVVTTPADTPQDRLRAGEAVGSVLLAATAAGYATCPLSQALELSATRTRVRNEAGGVEYPQLVLRIGRTFGHSGPVPETPRRALSAVLR